MKIAAYCLLPMTTVLFLAGCSGKPKDKTNGNSKKSEAIDVSLLDTTINPGDDFFEYVNRKWIEKNPIPASKNGWGMFSILQENSSNVLKDIQEKASKANASEGTNTQIIGDFYASGMDSVAIDKAGLEPLKDLLDDINEMNS